MGGERERKNKKLRYIRSVISERDTAKEMGVR